MTRIDSQNPDKPGHTPSLTTWYPQQREVLLINYRFALRLSDTMTSHDRAKWQKCMAQDKSDVQALSESKHPW